MIISVMLSYLICEKIIFGLLCFNFFLFYIYLELRRWPTPKRWLTYLK